MFCVIDVFCKYSCDITLKGKRGKTIIFQKILKHSDQKPNIFWVDKGREFYKRPTKSLLGDNIIGIYSACNEWKSVVAEQFSITYKTKNKENATMKMKLPEVVQKCNSTS